MIGFGPKNCGDYSLDLTTEIVDVVVDMLTATDVKHDENDKLVRHNPGEGVRWVTWSPG